MLSPESDSEAARRLLAGADSLAEAREWYARLPDDFRADVDAISPSQFVGQWSRRTAMRVMHDRGDPLIPAGESRRLVDALRQQRPDITVYYTETGHLPPRAPRRRPGSEVPAERGRGSFTGICTTSSRWRGSRRGERIG